MSVEIERKFLVDLDKWSLVEKPKGLYCKQCYLTADSEKSVRVRVLGEKGFMTIKGKTSNLTRPEFEYEIPAKDAEEMILLFGKELIEKTRYLIDIENNTWEVDVFDGDNKGLIVAEIELKSENESFTHPNWISDEVSHDPKYINANLQKEPFCNWKQS